MDDKAKTVRVRVLRDFNDAGTERGFTAKSEVDVTEGELANYRACGLVEPIETEATATTADGDGDAKKGVRKG